ncbi:MAG TPA: class I SAM-dependent methyltransferase, partial [Thermohalobaculum sp.]|nr:class I SAM-dependent methyltransferase [Thermohalobaculum sp.]
VGIGNALIKLRSGGFDVWGVEPSQPFRAKALEHTGITGERIQLAAVEDADFAPESFDLITFGAVLEHIYNPSEAIVRALRWLKPEGVIHVEVPSSDHLIAKLINAYFTLAGTNFVTNISPMHVPYHIHEFTLDSFRRNGLRSGYEVLEHHFDVASIYHLPKVMHPLLRAIMARTNTGMQLTVWLRKAR